MSNEVKPPQRTLQAPVAPNGVICVPALSAKRAEQGLMVNSRNPIVTVETSEEARFSTLVECVAEELGIPLYVWSVTAGLGRYGGAALYNSDQPEQALTTIASIQGDGIFLLKDFCRYCDNDRISRGCGIWRMGFGRGDGRSCCLVQPFNCRRNWMRMQ